MTAPTHRRLIPLYSSRGEAEAFLAFPYLYNRSGEWIGWITPAREVYSVLGYFVGRLTDDARIVRHPSEDDVHPHQAPPAAPGRITTPAVVPLAPMLRDLTQNLVDVLQDEPERLHTLDSGELRQDLD